MEKTLRVWHIPQVPMEPFFVGVESVEEGVKILDVLTNYDAFQLEFGVKPDYSNASGLQQFDVEKKEWEDWFDEYRYGMEDDLRAYLARRAVVIEGTPPQESELPHYIPGSGVTIGGEELRPEESLKLRNHSPDGFSWGYSGSGPAQLALALLLHFTDETFALRWYQDFKFEVIAGYPMEKPFRFPVSELEDWVARKLKN